MPLAGAGDMFGKAFGGTFFLFLFLAVVSGLACWLLRGPQAATEAAREAAGLFLFVMPQLVAGLLAGGLMQSLISRDWMERSFGGSSGMRGLFLASFGGMITPTGPFGSFPLVFALWQAGADIGTLVAYLTSWAVIGIHRVLVWEVPLMGVEFSLLRFAVSLPLPILAGLLARRISRWTGLATKPEGAA